MKNCLLPHPTTLHLKILTLLFVCMSLTPDTTLAIEPALTRRDGFLMMWQSIGRPVASTKEKPYTDVPKGVYGFEQITFAKARGILDDTETTFRPDDPLTTDNALLWMYRTRSVEPLDDGGKRRLSSLPDPEDLVRLNEVYGMPMISFTESVTKEKLLTLQKQLDDALRAEEHEVSLYAEKFHGKGTAFGETFNMHDLTAAHRTFPVNTLVRVTNIDNEQSVVVRINDRGPFVQGRDMDLSLAAFTSIADRSKGKIRARFERLGDAEQVSRCIDNRFQKRIIRGVQLRPGIPHTFALGRTLSLTSDVPFVIRDLIYPDGTHLGMQTWVTKGESFDLSPSIVGRYRFIVGSLSGRVREMHMEVVDCG